MYVDLWQWYVTPDLSMIHFDCPATKDVRSKDRFESLLPHPPLTTAVAIKEKHHLSPKRKYLDANNNKKKKRMEKNPENICWLPIEDHQYATSVMHLRLLPC